MRLKMRLRDYENKKYTAASPNRAYLAPLGTSDTLSRYGQFKKTNHS